MLLLCQNHYLKSTITQIERRFDIPSSLVGLIDGSFEIGMFYTHSPYFANKPKLIGAGCIIMSLGTFLTPPHVPCTYLHPQRATWGLLGGAGWDLGDLGGLSQTPASPSSPPLVLFLQHTPVAILGPILGFLLGSLCAKLYVDIGFIDMGTIAITHKDPHWVGAWSLGYLIAGMVSNLAANPFWFLSKHLPRPEIQKDSAEQSRFIFLPSLKSLLGNPVYFLYLCSSIIQFNSLIGMVTYKPKYIEQQFGQSSSKTNFIIGMVKILVAGNEADATLFGV
uniref:Uncharacterized protein n=1 Tax=Naja naja TaxID=35670 RepID=A0A8C6VH66_NAJNA